jgi:hypothetical protein
MPGAALFVIGDPGSLSNGVGCVVPSVTCGHGSRGVCPRCHQRRPR